MPLRSSPLVCAVPGVVVALAGSAQVLGDSLFPASIELSSLDGTNGFVITGIAASDSSGYSVSRAGDVNGDGIDDILIGAFSATPNGHLGAGKTYVVFGGLSVGASGTLNLSTLNGANGFVVNGINSGDHTGGSVSSAGDVNGDGVDDILIGVHGLGGVGTGKSYVVFGKNTSVAGSFPASIDLASLNGSNGFAIPGIALGGYSGWSVSSAGDINGDGIDDIVIGACHATAGGMYYAGESYVVFGKNTSVAGPFTASIDLSTLNGTNGFVINGIHAFDRSGYSVSSAGDINGDGVDDILIGADTADPGGLESAGSSYVVFGKNTSVAGPFGPFMNLASLNGTNGFVINGIHAYDTSGFSVSSAGDVNGDGVDDILIGAYDAAPNGHARAGESYVVFGGSSVGASGAINLAALNSVPIGTNGFVLDGIDAFEWSGSSVSSAGDVNSDGVDDIIIGARFANPGGRSAAGRSYVVFGKKTSVAGPFYAVLGLSDLNGTNGFVANGIDANDHSGRSVSSAGDVNGDGIDDLIIGAYGGDPNGHSYAGESYVVFGRAPSTCAGDINGDGRTNVSDFNILAGYFGQAVASGTHGDFTGNGIVNVGDFNILAGDYGCGP